MKKLSVPMRKSELFLGWIYFVLQMLAIPYALSYGNYYLGYPLSDAELNFLFFCINFVSVIFIFWRFLIANGKNAIQSPVRCLSSAVLSFCVYWLSSIVIGILIVMIYPEFSNVNDDSVESLVQENVELISFATVVLVPITEEVLYRGLIFRGLYNRSRFAAYAVSVLGFAAVHVIGYITMYEPLHLLLCFLQYIPAGVCLGWAYARADSIWAPILIHIAINQIGILAMR